MRENRVKNFCILLMCSECVVFVNCNNIFWFGFDVYYGEDEFYKNIQKRSRIRQFLCENIECLRSLTIGLQATE